MGGRPCGVELEGLDLSTGLESSSSTRFVSVGGGRGGNGCRTVFWLSLSALRLLRSSVDGLCDVNPASAHHC
jgi:hypothetical protein